MFPVFRAILAILINLHLEPHKVMAGVVQVLWQSVLFPTPVPDGFVH